MALDNPQIKHLNCGDQLSCQVYKFLNKHFDLKDIKGGIIERTEYFVDNHSELIDYQCRLEEFVREIIKEKEQSPIDLQEPTLKKLKELFSGKCGTLDILKFSSNSYIQNNRILKLLNNKKE